MSGRAILELARKPVYDYRTAGRRLNAIRAVRWFLFGDSRRINLEFDASSLSAMRRAGIRKREARERQARLEARGLRLVK